ncbi:MAG TPA: DUF3418 domain-containing protein, partial [Pontiella sp.]|nr:DUF3418 domain-containing protein [Pontiella sp.]
NYRRVMEWTNLWRDLRDTATKLKWAVDYKDTKNTRDYKDRSPNSSCLSVEKNSSHYDLIHRSLLAGLPANIGLKGEQQEFQGTRGRKFYIFPGSALFRKPTEWVMTFALVETTKLYARIVAQIQPEWLEDVAPHLCKAVYKKPEWNPDKGFVYAKESIVSGGLTLLDGRPVHYGPIQPEEARKIFIHDGMVPGHLSTQGGWLKLHQQMLDEIASLEEKIRRPGSLLDADAIYEHFDRLLPDNVYSVKTLEQWIRKAKARIAMRLPDAIFPQSIPIAADDYPDELSFHDESFHLLYTFDPGEELDGIALVCPVNKLAFLPDWAPDWLVPGWLEEKVNRLLRTLPKNLRAALAPIDQTARRFVKSDIPREQPLLHALSAFLQKEFTLPVDASDFDETALPGFLRMKIIETENNEIVRIHTGISDERLQSAQLTGAALAMAKWELPPQSTWPGDELPVFITANDAAQTRGYPALTAKADGVGRRAFLSPVDARYSHRAGLSRLFRIQQADQVKYIEKRPPLTPALQLTLSALDSDFLSDLLNLSIVESLTSA